LMINSALNFVGRHYRKFPFKTKSKERQVWNR